MVREDHGYGFWQLARYNMGLWGQNFGHKKWIATQMLPCSRIRLNIMRTLRSIMGFQTRNCWGDWIGIFCLRSQYCICYVTWTERILLLWKTWQ
jgi:hypothetical protein